MWDFMPCWLVMFCCAGKTQLSNQHSFPSLKNSAGLSETDKDLSGQYWFIYLTWSQQLPLRQWQVDKAPTAHYMDTILVTDELYFKKL